MPFSARPGPEAIARVQALLPRPGADGWTPGQPPAPESSSPAIPTPEAVTPGAPAESTTVRQLLEGGRWDPGRQGVIALVAVAVVAALVAGALVLRGRPSEQPIAPVPVVAGSSAPGGPEVVVDVAGKVRKPGLVRLPAGSRVDDAVRAAGGVLPGISTGTLNLAAKLTDGQQVLVAADQPAGAAGPAAGGLLDLNAATAQDFDALPGIGPVLADRVVAWRTEHGRFASVDQLREVSGIGEAKYQSLKAKVRV